MSDTEEKIIEKNWKERRFLNNLKKTMKKIKNAINDKETAGELLAKLYDEANKTVAIKNKFKYHRNSVTLIELIEQIEEMEKIIKTLKE